MAKFQQFIVAAMLLALSAPLCWAASLGPVASGKWAEGPYFADGPSYDVVLSPSNEQFVSTALSSLVQCVDRLGRGQSECVNTVYQVVGPNEGLVPSDPCCKNIVELDAAQPNCWNFLFPEEILGRDVVPALVAYCQLVGLPPVAAPGPSPTTALE